MEFRHLLYFKTVADELHFRKAAEKLFISQPPLSRQIKELEEELEIELFIRNNRRVVLTDAGKLFKKEVDEILSKIGSLKHRLKELKGAVSGQLRIGYISSVNQEELIKVLMEVKEVFPLVKTRLYELPTVKQVKALEDDKLDIGIIRSPVKSVKLDVKTLFEEKFVLVVKKGTLNANNMSDLAGELEKRSFVFFNKDYSPEYFAKLEDICQRMGFYPDVSHEANNVHSILQLVEKGVGVSIVPASLKGNFKHLELDFFELDELPITTEVVMAFKATNDHPACKWFIDRFQNSSRKD